MPVVTLESKQNIEGWAERWFSAEKITKLGAHQTEKIIQ